MPGDATLRVGRSGEAYVVQVAGRGTLRESCALQSYAQCILSADGAELRIDLTACEYLDSTFLGCLVRLHKQHNQATPPRFRLIASPAKVAALLKPLRLDRLFLLEATPPPLDSEAEGLAPAATDPCDLGRHVMECHQLLADLGGPQREAFARIAEHLSRDLERAGRRVESA